jgi:RecA-family ATPase
MVYRRLKQLATARNISSSQIDRNLLVNTEEQSTRFKIDREADLMEMADWLKMMGVEFCVIDVLNRLHDQQENSSDDMTKVMQRFDALAARAGCQVCVIHHTNKSGGVKGSTSIMGCSTMTTRRMAKRRAGCGSHSNAHRSSCDSPSPHPRVAEQKRSPERSYSSGWPTRTARPAH